MKDFFRLDGKVALVMGGAGGIGQGIATGLAFYGATVCIASRNKESLKCAQSEIEKETGKDIHIYVCDASQEDQVNALADELTAAYGKVDILVNSQGFNRKYPITEFPADIWDQLFETNVKSVMLCCKAFGGRMKAQGGGRILNLSSVRGIRGCGGGNAGYGATKGAVDMLTKMLAAELGPEVAVNAIGPTVIETPMMRNILTEDLKKMLAGGAPMKRIGKVDDCIGPAVFLCSEAAGFITGQIIYPDGGLTAVG